MAKKQTVKKQTATEAVVEQVEVSVIEKPVMVETPVKTPKDSWVIEDKVYYLKAKNKPLSRSIKSSGVYFFDEEKGYERELKYCQNQRTPFVDEMIGDQRLEHIVFRNGALHVTREKQTLQRLLSLYHPDKDTLYYEYKPQVIAENELDWLEFEVEALTAAMNLDVDMAEAVMRVEMGSKVSRMSSKELKRDLLLYARKNPKLFLELVNDDNVLLRNFGIKATELNIITLSQDQRHFTWGSTGRKLMTVPFDEHPYSALAQWFKTDEGMEIYTNIEKRLS
jgi:hypothetical protein